jgi:hypothetical protein
MSSMITPRTIICTLREYNAISTDQPVTTAVDYFVVPFACRLKSVQALGHGQAGTTASKAYLDLDPVTTNLDNTITAVATGVTGNDITIAIEDDSASVKSSLDLGAHTTNIDSVIQAATAGNSGDMIRIVIMPGAAAGAGAVMEDLVAKIVYFQLDDGVSTVADFEALVASATLLGASGVKTAGTATNVYVSATDDLPMPGVNLAGGYTTANTLTEASLNLATCCPNIDTVVESTDTSTTFQGGDHGNDVKITIVGGAGAKAGVMIEDTTNRRIIFQLKDNTSTVADFESLVATCTLIDVKTAGTAGNKFQQDDDCIEDVPLAGGVSPCHVTVSGSAITIKCKNAVTVTGDIDKALGNTAAAAALVTCDAGAGGTFASTDDEITATNLALGADAKPTIEIYKNGSEFMADHMNTTTAITAYTGDLGDGQSGTRPSSVKCSANDILTMRCTTTSSDGALEHATCTLTFEY